MNIDLKPHHENQRASHWVLTFDFWWRLIPGSLAALLVFSLLPLGTWQPLDALFDNVFFRLRGPMNWGNQVVVVEIDDASIDRFGALPWPRSDYTEFLNRLDAASPDVVAFDLLFSESTADDPALAEAMQQSADIVLAQSWDSAGLSLVPTESLRTVAAGVGFITPDQLRDDPPRQVDLMLDGQPSFAYVAAQRYAQRHPQIALPTLDQPFWVNWFGPAPTIPRYSFAAVLDRQVPADAFANKLVLVGITATPFNRVSTPYDGRSPIANVLVHATVINNMLQHNALHPIPQHWLYAVLGLLAPVMGFVLTRRSLAQQLLIWGTLCITWACLSLGLFQSGYWLPPAMPVLLFGAIGAGVVLSDQYRTAKLLQQSEERYALAVNGSNEGLWDWNLKTGAIYFSPRWQSMLGYSEGMIGDRPADWFDRVHSNDLESLKAEIDAHLTGNTSHFEHEHRILHQDGSYRWVLSRGMAVRDKDNAPCRMAGSQTDITERKEAEDQLRRMALFDTLTELPNRTFFLDAVQQAIAHNAQQPLFSFAVFLLDVDRFQVVNNSLGTPVGDQLLGAIACRLKSFLPPQGVIARLSGDEFGILLNCIETFSSATRMAEQIQQVLSLPFHLNGHEVFTTASIGITLSDAHYVEADQLLRDADTALYRAKRLGRARYQVFDQAMHTRMVAKLQIENDLRRAIAHEERRLIVDVNNQLQELMLYYQPIVQLATGKVVGFEALVRWNHPEQGFLSPAKFIATAEETGLIIPLGWWILRQACQQMRDWQNYFTIDQPLTMNVNLASKQFCLSSLPEHVYNIVEETGIDASRLKLEITEGTIMENGKSVIATLHRLRSLGIQLAIDDFGTGYSSLSYLHRFPINTLKIDRSFVSRMSADSENTEIVRTIVELAHNLSMDVTAEGVEQSEQSHQLLTMGCEYGQGYLFSKPLDSKAATEFLDHHLPKRFPSISHGLVNGMPSIQV